MSFRFKTILGIAVIESILLLILVISSLSFLHDSNDRQLLERADSTAQLFASATKDAVLATDLARLESFVSDILSNPNVTHVRIKNADGTVLAEGGAAHLLASERKTDQSIDTVDDGAFDVAVEIKEAGLVFGSVELGLSTAAIHSVLDEARTWAILIAISEVLLVALFSFLLGTYLTRGLSRLETASQEVCAQGPGYQLEECGNDEIGQVTKAFNQMSRQLENSYAQLQDSLKNRDITLHRAERNWAKNQAILASSLDAIITVDEHGGVIDYNPAAEAIFGWQAHEVKGLNMSDFLIPPEFREAHRKGMERYLATGSSTVLNQRLELVAMHKAGHRIPVEIAISDTSTPDGLLFTAFLRDLSQQYADQTELRLAAAAFETIEPMFITDANARILRTNRAFTKTLGYTEQEVVGKTPALWSSGQYDQSFYKAMWHDLKEQGHWSGEIYNLRKNGERFPELLSISAVRDDHGEITHYIAHLVDISEQKNRETALQIASKQAKQAEEAKGRFLAVMSHEIRTPLNAVIGMLEVLAETPLNAHQRELLQTSQESSWLLLSVINNILDFSKMEAGKLSLGTGRFNLHQSLARTLEMFRTEADKKHVHLALNIAPSVPIHVKGDGFRLRQIIVNLISNALKFTQHGQVSVNIEATAHAPTHWWTLSCTVQDTGIGIAKDQLDLLFKEFSMVDQSHSRQADGTGLGLVICKRLVEMMGGEISVSSQPGEGSCFSFSIKVQTTSSDELNTPSLINTGTLDYPVNLLIAEDNPANQRVIEAMLENTSASIHLVSDGQSAVDALEHQTFDLILMDISMPKMDGITATHAIRSLSGAAAQTPIIAMTAHRLSGDREQFLDAGMNDYLAKPMRKEDLLAIIERWTRPDNVQQDDAIKHSTDATSAPHESTEPAWPLVDETVLTQLVKDTSAEIVPELLAGYIEDAHARLTSIKNAIQADDIKQLEFETHTLGSSAAAHGNTALFRAARAIEQLCRDHASTDAFQQANGLIPLAERSLQHLGQRITQGFTAG